MVEHAPEERGVVSSILTFGTMRSIVVEVRTERSEDSWPEAQSQILWPSAQYITMKEFFTNRFQTIKDYFVTQQFPTTVWKNVFSWEYWTESGLPSSSAYSAFSATVLVIGIIFLFFWRFRLTRAQKTTPVFDFEIQQIANVVTFVIIMSLSYAFFRSQQIAFASSRLVVLISLLVTVGWIVVILVHIRRVTPKMRASYLEKERFFRYLPKKRKWGFFSLCLLQPPTRAPWPSS